VKPVGYWVKRVDGLIEETFSRALDDVERREWQVLTVLAAGQRDEAGLVEALGPFPVGSAVESLVRRGWVEGRYALTPAGREAHAELSVRVEQVRGRLVEGMGAEGYRAVVRGLERMAENLERGLAVPTGPDVGGAR
jgi:hypothetical protein